MDGWLQKIDEQKLFILIILSLLASTVAGTALDFPWLYVFPWLLLSAMAALLQPSFFFYLLFFLLPFSTEYEFDNGLATDLPSEPLMVMIMGIAVFLFASDRKMRSRPFWQHPIAVILCIHFSWIIIAALFTSIPLVSLKFILAKTWYIIVFFIMGGILINRIENFYRLINTITAGFIIVIAIITIHHATIGFSFEFVNDTLKPFFRNHVSYGVMLVVYLPLVWVVFQRQEYGRLARLFFGVALALIITGIFLSYCRAAILSFLFIPAIYAIFKWRFLKPIIALFILCVGFLISYLLWDNHYLEFQPDYVHTISHKNLEDHLQATYERTDMSIAERMYRWVAAGNMISEHPYFGFGPGTYISFYRIHSSRLFETYVSYSDNDLSTSHNYFLLLASEQGIMAVMIFASLCIVFLLYSENIYHRLSNIHHKRWAMAVIISQCLFFINICMADLVEVDKTGSVFFLNLAMMINLDIISKNNKNHPITYETI